jgi:hypothetical protein
MGVMLAVRGASCRTQLRKRRVPTTNGVFAGRAADARHNPRRCLRAAAPPS